jgi:adenosylmethionine-8-amino-7-oxononanoate aminotransferase
MSVTGFEDWRWPFAPPVPGASHVPHPTCIRCPLSLSYPSCGLACVETFDQAITKAGAAKVGAVIAEPVSAASSAHVPPPEYWPRLRAICSDRGVPLIADEIVTGFGRTGKLFGLEHWDVTPDILVVGKGLTSGYAPMAAVLVSAEFAAEMDEAGFVHGFTFSGHPVAAAAAMANLDILLGEGLTENAARQGARLKANLEAGLAVNPIVADVRGLGLLLSIELAADPAARRPFPDAFALAKVGKEALLDERVLCRTGNQIRLGPPLSITEAETDDLSERLVRAIGVVEMQTRAWR